MFEKIEPTGQWQSFSLLHYAFWQLLSSSYSPYFCEAILFSVRIYLYNLHLRATCIFMFLLYVWFWNTFGKTVLEISPTALRVLYKFKLFSKPKIYQKSEIIDIGILDLSIERAALFTRRNYLVSTANQSIVVITNAGNKNRIIDWPTVSKANELLIKIKTILGIQHTVGSFTSAKR